MSIHSGGTLTPLNATADEARALTEGARENWKGRAFLRELFLGTLHPEWIDPWPETPVRPEVAAFLARLDSWLAHEVDSARIDADGSYGADVIEALRRMGAFGLKIPKAYGGLGLTQAEYCRACEIIGRHDGSIAALVSAHNSIGVPMPLASFGTEEQKRRYLPRLAAGAVSAFALTEPDAGSDPARLATTARRHPDGGWVLDGEKLWITNGTIAELMIVMARNPDDGLISAFIVEGNAPGLTVRHRCRFMGLRALENAWLTLEGVRVADDALLGAPGQGLKIALVTLNTGRLSLPAAALGGARRVLEASRDFAARRVQWGAPVGQHEAISHKLADMAATVFAMESWCRLAAELAMREGYDIRLEAAAAKEFGSTRGWTLIDEGLQIHGGRGYETERSMRARGEVGVTPIERMMRDARINRIFEGSSEIMHLFMARELVDRHLAVAGPLLDRKATLGDKLRALPKIAAFYAGWYPRLWLGATSWLRYGRYGDLARHVRWADRTSRRLARTVFHLMVRHQAGLEKRQGLLFRTVDIAMEVAVVVATVVHAHHKRTTRAADAEASLALADTFAWNARRIVEDAFARIGSERDADKHAVGQAVLTGGHAWLEARSANPDQRAAAK
jgi:alkylation response protein AidB-like acyl-CoA dehydrogenase